MSRNPLRDMVTRLRTTTAVAVSAIHPPRRTGGLFISIVANPTVNGKTHGKIKESQPADTFLKASIHGTAPSALLHFLATKTRHHSPQSLNLTQKKVSMTLTLISMFPHAYIDSSLISRHVNQALPFWPDSGNEPTEINCLDS